MTTRPIRRPRKSSPLDASAGASRTVERLRQEQRSLRELLEAMGGELTLSELLTRILRSACELLDADHGSVGLVDRERSVVRTEAAFNMPPDELGAVMRAGEGIAGEVLRTRKPVIVQRYGDLDHPTQLAFLDHSVLGMPIKWRGEMIGFFGIGRSTGEQKVAIPFTSADKSTLETFARYAAIAIRIARGYHLERQRSERLALITRVGRIITANLQLDELLQNAADALHEVLGYANVAIPLLHRGDPDELVIATIGGNYRHLVRGAPRLPITRGIMGAAARTRLPVLVNDVERDPRYVRTPGSRGIYSELAVPILLGDECIGVLNVESDRPLSGDDADHLHLVADQLAVAIDNARMHDAARELAVVDERHRLARELHDSVTQLIFSGTLVAQSLAPAWRRDPAEGERRTARLLELSQQALGEMRSLLTELRTASDVATRVRTEEMPTGLGDVRRHGLAEAIRRHAASVAVEGLVVAMSTATYVADRKESEDALYRIAQEALFNVVKHARARHVRVELASSPAETRLRIADDGVGLPASRKQGAHDAPRGYGLVFMRERAEALGGALVLRRRARRGTVVEATIPRSTGDER